MPTLPSDNIDDYFRVAERAAFKTCASHPSDHDDAVQEGLIAIWKQMEKGVEVSEGLAFTIAKRRQLNMITTGHTEGHERAVVNAKNKKVHSLDGLNELVGVIFGSPENNMESRHMRDDFADPDLDTGVAVRSVLSMCSPDTRKYVFHRFYLDEGEKALVESIGRKAITNRLNWRTKYKPEVRAAIEGIPRNVK